MYIHNANNIIKLSNIPINISFLLNLKNNENKKYFLNAI